MQPVQIGLRAAVVLLALLLAVPVQLLVSHYFTSNVATKSGRSVKEIRADAVGELGEMAGGLWDHLHSTMSYYSKWSHLKELVVVPYKRKEKPSNIQVTLVKSGRGKTIIISESDSTKMAEQAASKTSKPLRIPAAVTKGTSPAKPTAQKKPVDEGTSPAREVDEFLMKQVYFGQSNEVRGHRPAAVQLSVGQVVKHKADNYYGVIIGWDETAKVPEAWLKKYYSEREEMAHVPHYLVLLDSSFDASSTPFTYIPQQDLQPVSNVQIDCPEMSGYFEGYKNSRHIPKPWLRNRYPSD